jgi:hypothetical protein
MTRKEIIKHYKDHYGIDLEQKLTDEGMVNIEWAESLLKFQHEKNESKKETLTAFIEWLWGMDRIRFNPHIKGIRNINEMVDLYLKDYTTKSAK